MVLGSTHTGDAGHTAVAACCLEVLQLHDIVDDVNGAHDCECTRQHGQCA
jgi:hypothetical protein